ncbi:hypothetical protein KP77_25010 [Jeotgalibacillus alimentarius]|uniref:Phage tail protein n=1 Tax=Jeotgalibacillus alimentarius TaxID=135826 RepID=A0A0C2VDA9_9BACL|nr:hypothetical protein [Jeotgalibacillus alimentarius]KIL46932.1 hypothetical protein KP77_25010 [Jeotgalibacillus alimentarius]
MAQGIDVPIGPATVEYGEDTSKVVFDVTKGGIVFSAGTTKQDTTIDQLGDTIVKSILKGRTAQVTVPFALHDLEKIAAAIPNSKYVEDATDPENVKKKVIVSAQAGYNFLKNAKKLVIKPTDPAATPNDWITMPLAGVMADPEYTYNSDNERVTNITFVGYPDMENGNQIYIMGDETAVDPAPAG